ncbi:MAG: hypothetical protein IPK14_15745 [Blastocatellia bacterium]|nr:hypothetical protein [Blastocatellia bacterium]
MMFSRSLSEPLSSDVVLPRLIPSKKLIVWLVSPFKSLNNTSGSHNPYWPARSLSAVPADDGAVSFPWHT